MRWWRRVNFPQARCEGLWAQKVNISERPYSLGVIHFAHGNWEYNGRAFDAAYQPAAKWESEAIAYTERDKKWLFLGKGQYIERSKGVTKPKGEEFRMLSTLRLDGSRIREAHGIDLILDNPQEIWIEPKRVDGLLTKEIATAADIETLTPDEIQQLFEKLR